MIALREYQTTFLQDVSAKWAKGARRVCGCLPTGAGKTVVGAEGARRVAERGRRGLWLAHREELVEQAAKTLEEVAGIRVGVLAASSDRSLDLDAPIIVASIQTILARGFYPEASIIFADECHHFGDTAEEWTSILTDHYPNTRVLGLTATPERGDGTGLAPIFDALVVGATVADLVALNKQDPTQGLVWCDVDRPGRMLKSGELAQPPVDHWLKVAENRPTIAFARNVAKAEELAAEFNARGVPARCVHAKTSKDDRSFALEAFRNGLIKVLTCVYVLTEGTDLPMAEVCLLARGAGSQTIFMQMVGRVLRPSPATGKRDALLIDLQGVSYLHRMPEDPRIFSLTGKAITVTTTIACPVCGALRDSGEACASCGWTPADGDRAGAPERITLDPMVRFARIREKSAAQLHEMLVRWIRSEMLKGHKPTVVFHKWLPVVGARLSKPEFDRAMKEITPEEIDEWKKKRKERAA